MSDLKMLQAKYAAAQKQYQKNSRYLSNYKNILVNDGQH